MGREALLPPALGPGLAGPSCRDRSIQEPGGGPAASRFSPRGARPGDAAVPGSSASSQSASKPGGSVSRPGGGRLRASDRPRGRSARSSLARCGADEELASPDSGKSSPSPNRFLLRGAGAEDSGTALGVRAAASLASVVFDRAFSYGRKRCWVWIGVSRGCGDRCDDAACLGATSG